MNIMKINVIYINIISVIIINIAGVTDTIMGIINTNIAGSIAKRQL